LSGKINVDVSSGRNSAASKRSYEMNILVTVCYIGLPDAIIISAD
jgi:hypothetical protein